MKKLIIFAALACMIAVPAMADSWTFIFETTGSPTNIRIQHKAMPDPVPEAQAFIESGGFTPIEIGLTSPQTFTVEYPKGVQYGMYAEAVAEDGSSSLFTATEADGSSSVRVWTTASGGTTSPAHYFVVIASDDKPKITDADALKE
jgi:hypothetical protein